MANTARVIADLERAELRVEQAEAERDEALERLAQAREERDHWIRLFNRMEAAVSRHRKDTAEAFASEVDDALHAAHERVLKAACSGSGEGGAE